jgi:hypothetical protein
VILPKQLKQWITDDEKIWKIIIRSPSSLSIAIYSDSAKTPSTIKTSVFPCITNEITKRTNFKMFYNHLTIDVV